MCRSIEDQNLGKYWCLIFVDHNGVSILVCSGDNEDVLSYLNYSVVFLISFPAYRMQTFI